jgi:hypothetical protein
MTIDQKVEFIRLPKKGIFKVVQIYLDNKPYLMCGDKEKYYHYQLLESFLLSKEVEYASTLVPGTKLKVADLEGERYKVAGMGSASINQQEKKFDLPGGFSEGYKIRIDEEFNELIKKEFEGWDFKEEYGFKEWKELFCGYVE